MRRFALLAGLCALAVGAAAASAQGPMPMVEPTPSPSGVISTIDVTPPPQTPGAVISQTATPSTPPRSRRRGRSATPEPSATPVQSATPTPAPSPTPSPTPLTNVDELPAPSGAPVLFPGIVTGPNVAATPVRVLIHALPTQTAAPRPPGASPEPAVSAPAEGLRSAPGLDRAYDLVGGKWTCRTYAGTPLTHTYRRDEDAISLVVDTAIRLADRTASLREHYRYHPSTGRWSASLADGMFVATAPQWSGTTWTFSGIDSEGGRATEATMVYKRVDAYSFTRTFTRIELDGKNTRSGEQCLRISQ